MKKTWPTVIVILLFLIGLSLMLYPTLSNWWNSLHASAAIVDYETAQKILTEEDYEKLIRRMYDLGLSTEGLDWYLDLRKYGSCVHSGFGMGFERLLIYLTGVENIRDVIPFPRTPKNCEF